MAILHSAFGADVSDLQVRIWYGSCLESIPYELGARVAARIVREDQFMPRPARFNEVRRAEQSGAEPSLNQLPSPRYEVASPERTAYWQAKCRETMAEGRGKKHWHGGPKPCPECGALPPVKANSNSAKRAKRSQSDELYRQWRISKGKSPERTRYEPLDAPWNARLGNLDRRTG